MSQRGEYAGWTRGTYCVIGTDVEAYHAHHWGCDLYIEAVLVDILDEDRAERFLQRQLVKMLAKTGPATA